MGKLASHGVVCCFLSVLLLAVVGCGGSEPSRTQVTGTVTFDGSPVADGQIVFIPSDGKGPADGGQVTGGKFTCEVTPGAKRVEITATRESGEPAADGLPNYEPYIPAAYNTESKLTADVKASGDNTLTFDLKADGS